MVPNGLDPADWAVEPADHDPGVVHAVSTMRLSVRKRPLQLLGAVHAAQQQLGSSTSLRLTVFGDGKLMPRMRRFIARNEMADTVTLAGRVDRDELKAIYARSDLFVAPAFLESFGIAALEARCAGLPVLAMRGTGITEFVADRREGLLADGDAAMAAALVEISRDADLRRGIAEHNRTTQPPTAWPTVLERVNNEYARAAAIRAALPGDRRLTGCRLVPACPARSTPAESDEGVEPMAGTDVIVVGGGHNGLVAAILAAQAGKTVTVLERADHPGGATVGARLFPPHPARLSRYSYLIACCPDELIHRLGIELTFASRAVSSFTPVTATGSPARLAGGASPGCGDRGLVPRSSPDRRAEYQQLAPVLCRDARPWPRFSRRR